MISALLLILLPPSLALANLVFFELEQYPMSTMKLKTIIHSVIFTQIYRALSKAKSISVQILKDMKLVHFMEPVMLLKKSKKKKNLIFLGSFRMHYNWCSAHVVVPMPSPSPILNHHLYYDSTWDSYSEVDSPELSGYLNWLEVDKNNASSDCCKSTNDNNIDDVDRLADMFIASCHEKFKLEKQESYRRFQEMMARSV